MTLDEKVDLVAGDFNGAAWRCDNKNNNSTIEEVPTAPCRCLSASRRCGDLDRFWATGLTFAGSLNLLIPIGTGKFGLMFSIPHEALGLRPADQSCHHESWPHLDFVGWHDVQPQREEHDQRILLKERSSPYHCGKKRGRIGDVMSDHSLSSWHRDHSRTFMGATYNDGLARVFTKRPDDASLSLPGSRTCPIQTLLLIIHIA